MNSSESEIDQWLRQGARVVTASARAARALATAFHRTRRAEGLQAWAAPNILDWTSFARTTWEEIAADGRLVLNPIQEEALWAEIALKSNRPAALLARPRHRLAALAMEAHALVCSHASPYLEERKRAAWNADAAIFSDWLKQFDEACRADRLVSPARLPLELISILEKDSAARPPILLAGFDRILPMQRSVLDAWGAWRQIAPGAVSKDLRFFAAADPQAELDACARWCGARLADNPDTRLLVIAQDANQRRGEIERALLRHAHGGDADRRRFEFSLGVPLGQTALARSAFLLLKWLGGTLTEQEIDWLLATGQCAATPQDAVALQGYMRLLRRRGLQRTQWTLADWMAARSTSLPAQWTRRILSARALLDSFARRAQSPLDWAALAPRLLDEAGWPGWRPLSSAEFQTAQHWQQALDTAGSLGYDGRQIAWPSFLDLVERVIGETLFAPESKDAPIQITGPAESAGLTADAIWFLGAEEDAWPSAGATHPLLPIDVQRETGMPYADPVLDWELAEAAVHRIAASAVEIRFSYACRNQKADARPSKMIVRIAGEPQPLPAELHVPQEPGPIAIPVEESAPLPFPHGAQAGGASVLTAQSQCPFRAFATARMDARGWESAQPCLTAPERGQLLHATLHSVWSGPPHGLSGLDDLRAVQNLTAFVRGHVCRAMEEMPAGVRACAPQRYLELEEERLCQLVTEWLQYEAARQPFTLEAAEIAKPVTIAGLTLNLRLDRIDRLGDGSLLVVDYKSGNAGPASWALPRPDDVQLPLYAGFGIAPKENVGGLVLAKIRAGNHEFAGRVRDARATLDAKLSAQCAIVKNPLTDEELTDWRNYIEQLARDFLAGRAEADPRKPPETCRQCGLQALCRIYEISGAVIADAEERDE